MTVELVEEVEAPFESIVVDEHVVDVLYARGADDEVNSRNVDTIVGWLNVTQRNTAEELARLDAITDPKPDRLGRDPVALRLKLIESHRTLIRLLDMLRVHVGNLDCDDDEEY